MKDEAALRVARSAFILHPSALSPAVLRRRQPILTDNAIVRLVLALLKHAHPTIAAPRRVNAQPIDSPGVRAAGHIQKALTLQDGVLRPQEQAQGVLGALLWGQAVAQIGLIPNRQQIAHAHMRCIPCSCRPRRARLR